MRRRKFLFLTVAVLFLTGLASKTAFAEYDIAGWWLLEGNGYAEKSFVRTELADVGRLNIKTQTEDGVQYLLGYSLDLWLDVSRFNINAWKYSRVVSWDVPIPLPELDPTMNDPFELPPVTVEGLTYELALTTTTSGTVKIYGYLDIDVVGTVGINSMSTIWKNGTKRPIDTSGLSSGCNTSWTIWTLLTLLTLLPLLVKFDKFDEVEQKKRQ
jgi:hypothetical protein